MKLELAAPRPYFRHMKRIGFLLLTLTLCAGPTSRGQDAATEERLNQLSGKIETILEGQEALRKRLNELAREIETVREQASKPTGNYASQEDLQRLIKEIDRKRLEDNDKIRTEFLKLGKMLTATTPSSKNPSATQTEKTVPANDDKPARPQTVFEHTIQSGDTISAIIAAYRDKNIKVTQDQILKANPGLKPERLVVGKKIFIPAPEK